MLPLFLGSGYSVDFVLTMCAQPLGIHMHCVLKFIIFSTSHLTLKILFLCGFHWHSRYSIWIFTFILTTTLWFTGNFCDQKVQMGSDIDILG